MRTIPSIRLTAATLALVGGSLLTACNEGASITSPASEPTAVTSELARTTTASATITFEVRVPGYGSSGDNGWITISASCGGGGRIVRAGRPDACTDRVERNEQLRVRISARNSQHSQLTALTGVSSSNGFARGAFIPVPFSATFVVSGDPSFDNVHVAAVLLDNNFRIVSDVQERRVPIGRRPR